MILKFIQSFYSKLSFSLLIGFLVIGILLVGLTDHLSQSYQNEVEQKLHVKLAQHVLEDHTLMRDGNIDAQALMQAFHNMMILGPSFEFYLLDADGKISTYSAEPGKVKRTHVGLEPIMDFFARSDAFPILGDDPRSEDKQKIFSVAPIYEDDTLHGYLYIIIGGEMYDSVVDLIKSSHQLTLAAISIAVALTFGLGATLLMFAWLTRPLRCLACDMDEFRVRGFKRSALPKSKWNKHSHDEIHKLGTAFNELVSTLNTQYQKVKNTDQLRRELISYVSHDLRTPLASLQGYLETWQLKKDLITPQQGEELISIAVKNADQMKRLIEQLFELAHLDADDIVLEMETVSIAELAQDVITKLSLDAKKKGIELIVLPQDSSIQVKGNTEKLERVFSNLLDNAVRHCSKGDRIEVKFENCADQVLVRVIDTGIGIPGDELDKIFQGHYRASNSANGKGMNNGLGLAISSRIVELHGAKLTVKSTLGTGTEFSFSLVA